MTDTQNTVHPRNPEHDDDIDLLALLGRLWEGRWIILVATLVVSLIGFAYLKNQVPVYRASSLIQVEDEKNSLPGVEELSGMFESSSTADTEIQLIRSRRVLGAVATELDLTTSVRQRYFPLVGKYLARQWSGQPGELAEPRFGSFGAPYSWGGEKIAIGSFDVPDSARGVAFTLVAQPDGWELRDSETQDVVLQGEVGPKVQGNGYGLQVDALNARPGTEFTLVKKSVFAVVSRLQSGVSATEKGRDTGIIELSYNHPAPRHAEQVLDSIGHHYLQQNVDRNRAEAVNSLDFLRNSLPAVREELEAAENRLNQYQIGAESVDISAEAEMLLTQMVELETRISELDMERAGIAQRFQATHPRFKAWQTQMADLRQRRDRLEKQVAALPRTQQDLVRLQRSVKVSNEIYLQMLSRIQQLEVAKAGTLGSVRIIDDAATNTRAPVSPKSTAILGLSLFVGLITGAGIVVVRNMLNRGVEDPEVLESLGLPVYAGIPYSAIQHDLEVSIGKRLKNGRSGGKGDAGSILAVRHANDPSVEALRSLRTSLHFAMLGAENNIVMIGGPSPRVGKTFVSCNLAAVIAQGEKRVLLIDADLRRGTTHKLMGVSNERGLSSALVGSHRLEAVIERTQVPSLDVIPRGKAAISPSELLMSEQFEKLLARVSEEYDIVIVDTPPILAVTDAAIVGRHAGTSLLVTRFGMNPLDEIEQTRRRFELNGINIKGVIFNAIVRKASSYGYGRYGYYYYNYQSDKA